MKKLFLYSVLFFFSIKSFAFTIDIDYIRNNYEKSVSDKNLCQVMISELEKNAPTSVHLAYLGGLQIIWANHVRNPFLKWSTFKKGKNTIEKAIQKDTNNVEIRYVRLSIQQNCPVFLGYTKNIKEDEAFLKRNIAKGTSMRLQNSINILLTK